MSTYGLATINAAQSAIPEDEATKLSELISSANLEYSMKHYDSAAEIYSQATEIQASLNGEMNVQNAELLYLYGRCLFKVAVSKSDVLGGQVASNANGSASKPESETKPTKPAKPTQYQQIDEAAAKNPFFHIAGEDEEDDDDEDDDDEEAEGGEGKGEQEDDFETAYEILDLARVLYAKQMEDLEAKEAEDSMSKGKGKASSGPISVISPELKHIKERLSDTHDLQSEISLENERFEDAVEDSRSTLELRQQLDSKDSNFIAEAHYKLALALEFTFFKAVREAKEQQLTTEVQPKMLYEAVENLADAVISCDLRIAKEEINLAQLLGEDATKKKRDIKDVKEIVQDMLIRLSDLKSTAKSLTNEPLDTIFSPEITAVLDRVKDTAPTTEALAELETMGDATEGTLASVPGESTVDREARIESAKSKANDLSGLIKKKKVEKTIEDGTTNGSFKRKAEDLVIGEEKKVKFDL